MAPVLERLQQHSLSAVVDDFGAGYSSLARLGELPIASLKIDGNFIGRITSDPTSYTVVRSIVAIAKAHGLSIVAEGVEDAETLVAVEELGCDYAQGFHVALPAPPDKVAGLLFEASDAWLAPCAASLAAGDRRRRPGVAQESRRRPAGRRPSPPEWSRQRAAGKPT